MKRVLTAAVLIPVVLVLIFRGPLSLVTLACAIVAGLALWEYCGLAERSGAETPRVLLLVLTASLFAVTYLYPVLALPAFTLAAFIVLGVSAFRSPLDRVLPDTAYSVFGLLYAVYPLTLIGQIRAEPGGPSLLLFLFLVVWSGDVVALYVGRAFGKHKLAPRISPGKTWEGSIGSLLGSLILPGVVFLLLNVLLSRHLVSGGPAILVPPGSIAHFVSAAILLNIAAQLGDLLESAIKRGAGVKDSGTLLPGHGGILDRIDALLLAAPVLWYVLVLQQLFLF